MNVSRSSLGEISGLSATRARQRAIGEKLRELFDDVVQEPVPECFLDILRLADDGPGIGKA